MLGCAVQAPTRKEEVIDNIKQLDIDTQHHIVECIKEVTDNPEAVLPAEWARLEALPEEAQGAAFSTLLAHARRLAAERDHANQVTWEGRHA